MPGREQLERQAREGMTEVCRLYGIPASLGAAWGVLFASPHPLSLAEIASCVGVAKSTASTALRRLEHLRMVRRVRQPGDRSDSYEALTDPQQMLREWLERFIKPELGMADGMHHRMHASLQQASEAGDLDEAETAVLQERLAHLESATTQARALVDAFLSRA